ncbi:MAG: FtsX-like permease family protein [Ignavibacteria bacterium]|nr:FtsX-like permease family protein [Ignavibacteria bacterium]
MKWQNLFKSAFRSMLRSRMRSLLTTLGIIIGVSAVIVMVAIGQGAQRDIENQISALGTNLIIIYPGATRVGGVSQGAGSFNRFTMEDIDKLTKETTLLEGISPVVRSGGQIIGGTGNWSTSVFGVSQDYLNIRDWLIESGEFFTEREIRAKAKVAILGQTIVKNIFADMDPIGQTIRIRNVPFKVIGVLAAKGQSASGVDQDDMILAPSTTVLNRLAGGRHISFIFASAVTLEKLEDAQNEIRAVLREAHKLNPGDDDDFTIRNQSEIADAASETSRVLTLLLGSIAGVSLIVGGIGIMNIMLVSVTERTREIGIRLAIGAREVDIMIQFLTEAVVLSLIGGLIGILLAFGIVYILNDFSELSAVINPAIVFLAFIFSGAVGIFFGFYPARKASRLNPIDALRYE